jgi:hypothetical protein
MLLLEKMTTLGTQMERPPWRLREYYTVHVMMI